MGGSMDCSRLEDREKMMTIFNSLVSNGGTIDVRMEGESALFASRLVGIRYERSSSEGGERPRLIIDKLTPEEGNTLIESAHRILLTFLLRGSPCSCSVQYVGISNVYPCLGLIVNFPESIEIEERRREERITCERPELVSAEVRLGRGTKGDKVYDLNVINYSRHGLGLLVTRKDFDLLHLLNKGDTLPDITFFCKSDLIRMSGTVRHKTRIPDGHHRDCYIIGIEWKERRIYRLMFQDPIEAPVL
jgi:hypothetical protein